MIQVSHGFGAGCARAAALVSLLSILSTLGPAQTSFPETEPNGTKAEANPATCMVAGDRLTGVTTGTSTTAGSTLLATADTFRVQTCALSLGIYQHTLVITTGGTVGHTGLIRGLNQTGTVGVGGTIGTVDTNVQTSSTTTTPARHNTWYGFGKAEQIYYRITGTAGTTAAYTVTLSTTAIAPAPVPGTFATGPITITTVGQGHTTDTEVWLYDAGLNAIPTAGNDDEFGTTSLQSRLTRTLGPGTYYMALTTWNLANNQPSPADDDYVTGVCLDFPDAIANSSSTSTSTALNFSISDGATTTPVVISRTMAFGIVWMSFVVGPPPPTTVLAGSDVLTSPPGASTYDLTSSPIPAGFFGPGSDPFSGVVVLAGDPLGGIGVPLGVDTIVRRPLDAPLPVCPSGATIPIELVALSLTSTSPIIVTFNGGTSSSRYAVGACLSGVVPQQPGAMNVRREHANGGTFDSSLPVTPKLTFTKISGVDGLPLVIQDPGPTEILQAAFAPWRYDDGGLGVQTSPGGTIDHDCDGGTSPVTFPPTTNFVVGILEPGATCGGPGGPPQKYLTTEQALLAAHGIMPANPPPPTTHTPYCFGDGTGTPCPCLNHSAVGADEGCLNSFGTGASLRATGNASISADTVVLNAANLPASSTLFFQGTTRLNGGAGAQFGDGLRCAGGANTRLKTYIAAGTPGSATTSYPQAGDPSVSVRGGVGAPGIRTYQVWYRNSAPFCTTAAYNLSNGLELTWGV